VLLRTVDAQGHKLRTDAAEAYKAMREAAAAAGVTLTLNSAFRSMAEQIHLYNLYVAGTGNLAAKPGYSNHQGGVSCDISTGGAGYQSAQYRWLAANASRWGFINDVSTEPWHWTFKGVRSVA
jgi:LAS superfamily LD-carboxypeptidase LdcB